MSPIKQCGLAVGRVRFKWGSCSIWVGQVVGQPWLRQAAPWCLPWRTWWGFLTHSPSRDWVHPSWMLQCFGNQQGSRWWALGKRKLISCLQPGPCIFFCTGPLKLCSRLCLQWIHKPRTTLYQLFLGKWSSFSSCYSNSSTFKIKQEQHRGVKGIPQPLIMFFSLEWFQHTLLSC